MDDKRKLELFMAEGDTLHGFNIRPLTAGSIAILTKVNSPFFKDSEKTEYENYKSILDFAYVHMEDIKKVIKTSNNKELFDESVEEFGFQFDQNFINDLMGVITKRMEDLAVSSFEVQEELEEEDKKKL